MRRHLYILTTLLVIFGACSGPLGPTDLPVDGEEVCRLALEWDTWQLNDGSWTTAVTGSVVGGDADEWKYWVRFRLSATDSTGVVVGGPPPFGTGISHGARDDPIVYMAELTRKIEDGWTWEVVDTEEGVHVAPETP